LRYCRDSLCPNTSSSVFYRFTDPTAAAESIREPSKGNLAGRQGSGSFQRPSDAAIRPFFHRIISFVDFVLDCF